MNAIARALTVTLVSAPFITGSSVAAIIDFDDVSGREVDITTRYAGLGVTLNAIPNPFPLAGPFPAPANLPPVIGGVTTWLEGFPSALSKPQVAVSALTYGTNQPGNAGILISFAFDVSHVALVGNDVGGIGANDDESVTLTAYDAAGHWLGQTYSQVNLPGSYDQTPAAIDFPNMRYVAFNYTDTQYGFYAMDNLEFVVVPEPSSTVLLLCSFLTGGGLWIRRQGRSQSLSDDKRGR